jgi:prevent-host-death family protein
VTYTFTEAKKDLIKLINQAEAGQHVVVTKRGVPVIEIVPVDERGRRKPVFGVLGEKKIVIDPDWDKPIEDLEAWIAGEV